MPFVQCSSCGDTFETPDVNDNKCRECKLHQNIFEDILNDVHSPTFTGVSKKSYTERTPEEIGLKKSFTWEDAYKSLLESMHKEDIEDLPDLINIIMRMGWKRTRTHPWFSIIIVTYLYTRNPKMCEQKEMLLELQGEFNEIVRVIYRSRSYFNPFRFLRGSHPGLLTFVERSGKTFPELVAKAEALLKPAT